MGGWCRVTLNASRGRSRLAGAFGSPTGRYRLRPRLTTRLTFPPFGSTVPGFGLCDITRPGFTVFEEARRIVPTQQFARARVRLAAGNVFLATPCTAQRPGVLMSTETVFE